MALFHGFGCRLTTRLNLTYLFIPEPRQNAIQPGHCPSTHNPPIYGFLSVVSVHQLTNVGHDQPLILIIISLTIINNIYGFQETVWPFNRFSVGVVWIQNTLKRCKSCRKTSISKQWEFRTKSFSIHLEKKLICLKSRSGPNRFLDFTELYWTELSVCLVEMQITWDHVDEGIQPLLLDFLFAPCLSS